MLKPCVSRTAWRVCLPSVLLCLILHTTTLRTQQLDVRPYESEEDLWEALREGEISYDEYSELLERYRLGADSALVPMSDWEDLPGSDAGYLATPDSSLSPLVGAPSLKRPGNSTIRPRTVRWSWRSGVDGTLSSPTGQEGYTTARMRSGRWRALLHYREDDRGGRWQRRVLEYDADVARFQAGNVEPRWGRGLVVGRRSRLVGNSTVDPSPGDFWQPALSRFNGVRAVSQQSRLVAGDCFVSDIRSGELRERVAAFMLTAGSGTWKAGVAGLSGEIMRRDSTAMRSFETFGGHLQIGTSAQALLIEIASTGNGATAKSAEALWRFAHGRFHGSAWSYSAQFINPWGGGPGHSDQTSIDIPEINETWSSRTTGESGFALSTRVDPDAAAFGGRVRARWDWMTHRETPGEPLRHDWTARLEWRRRGVWVRPFARGSTVEDEPSRHSLGAYADFGDTDMRLSFRSEFGRHRADADRFVRLGIGGRWPLNNLVRLQPVVRWVDPDLNRGGDGYWYLYCTEVIFPPSWWQLETALVWQRFEDRGHGDVVEVRVRVNVAR